MIRMNILSVIEDIDILSISSSIINLFIKHSLPSSYFNSIILKFITERHILIEEEAKCLIN